MVSYDVCVCVSCVCVRVRERTRAFVGVGIPITSSALYRCCWRLAWASTLTAGIHACYTVHAAGVGKHAQRKHVGETRISKGQRERERERERMRGRAGGRTSKDRETLFGAVTPERGVKECARACLFFRARSFKLSHSLFPRHVSSEPGPRCFCGDDIPSRNLSLPPPSLPPSLCLERGAKHTFRRLPRAARLWRVRAALMASAPEGCSCSTCS
jgi:hypothetical protein